MPYSKEVNDRFYGVLNNPQKFSVGRFDPKDPNVATGMTGAPACGDVMKLQLKLDHNEKIIDVKFKTYGCGSAIASSTMFVDMLRGKTIEEAKLIKDRDIAKALQLPPIKLHCSVLAEDSIKKAIEDWEKKTEYRKHNQYDSSLDEVGQVEYSMETSICRKEVSKDQNLFQKNSLLKTGIKYLLEKKFQSMEELWYIKIKRK